LNPIDIYVDLLTSPAGWLKRRPMHELTNALVGLAVVGVIGVLIAGLVNMLRGGSANTSQTLMRWRVGLQFIAIIIIIGVLFFRK
jgi:hypothetical protein